MRGLLIVLALVLAIPVTPSAARAQCFGECVDLRTIRGTHVTYGCVVQYVVRKTCHATKDWCVETACETALLADDRGVVLASIQQCDDTGKALPVRLAAKGERKRGGDFVPAEPRTTAAASDHEEPTPVAGG